jgi:hypothetical protein
MANYFVYRINGGEVLVGSVDSQNVSGFFAQAQDPNTPDGVDLSVPKIYDGSSVRNATAQEIAYFAVAKDQDDAVLARSNQSGLLILGNKNGIVYKAIAEVMINEINILRRWIVSFKNQVALSSSLADLKTIISGLSDLPDRTPTQARNAVQSSIKSGNND